MKKVYLDYAASTPADPRVIKAMLPYFFNEPGNSMSLHGFGRIANDAVEKARFQVASLIKAQPEEIVFTGSATESNNLALKGIAEANQKKGKHIIISSIEHDCVMESALWLEKKGFKITKLKVNKYGLIDLKQLERAIKKDTILVSIIHASNEIGTIQSIREIGRICKEKDVYFHTDAAQSLGKLPIDVNKMNIDLLTGSSHKMYGPKGVACLFVRRGVNINPILHGGGHESGLRSSTLNVPAIVGFGLACSIALKKMGIESEKQIKLRDKLIKGVLKIKGSYLNGHPSQRLPNNANFRFDFIEGEALLIHLDSEGICGSTGSACSTKSLKPSHVLMALGLKPVQCHGSLRLTLSKYNTPEEVDLVLEKLPPIICNLRKISPLSEKTMDEFKDEEACEDYNH